MVNCAGTLIGWGEAWGSPSWGEGLDLPTNGPLPSAEPFDIFCVCGAASAYLVDYNEVAVDPGGAFLQDLVNNALGVVSSSGAADLFIDKAIPSSWTYEMQFVAPSLPVNFSDVSSNRFFIGVVNPGGVAIGLMLAESGIAYTAFYGAPFQVLPGSAGMIQEGRTYLLRVVADAQQGVVYIYLTESVELNVSGQSLRFVLLPLYASSLPVVPQQGLYISAAGTPGTPVDVRIQALCLATGPLMSNRQPVAVAGQDRTARICEVILLDASDSADPEGQPITYQWRLVDAPLQSSHIRQLIDGFTVPLPAPNGFTDKLYSPSFVSTPGSVGDVLRYNDAAYTVVAVGTDGTGSFVQLALEYLPDNLTDTAFRLIAQNGLATSNKVKATFLPDVAGFYKFDLQVYDGGLYSELDTVVVNAEEGVIPRGCTPDLSFMWGYLSDFWSLVEDRERIETVWSGLAQILSSELHALWQQDYGKSLRDIPSVVLRRWLHFDLLQREPYPELTTFDSVWTPIVTAQLGATANFAGQVLVLSVPFAEELLLVTVTLTGQRTPKQLAAHLEEALRDSDDRYRVLEINRVLYLYAPFPVTVVVGTTVSGFTVGHTTTPLQNEVGGTRVGATTFLASRSLAGIPFGDDDQLYVVTAAGTFLTTIKSVVDVPGDTFTYQRVNVLDALPVGAITSWGVAARATSKQLDFYKGLVSEGDRAVFEVFDVIDNTAEFVAVPALGTLERRSNQISVPLDELMVNQLAAPTRYRVFLWGVFRSRYLPIESLIADIPTLQQRIKDPAEAEVLVRNVDYFLETFRGQNCIRFDKTIYPSDFVPLPRLWAEHVYINNEPAIEAQFGVPADFLREDAVTANVDYLSAVRGLWYAYTRGPTLHALRVGTQILLGLPFAEAAGKVEEIRTDFSLKRGRILIRDTARSEVVRSYYFPRMLELELSPVTGKAYVEGDTVEAFAPLVRGVEILDRIKRPDFFQVLANQGLFNELEKFHTFMVRVDASVFTIPSLAFILSFIRRIKPTYTMPLFVVATTIDDAEVDITDDVAITAVLELIDGTPFKLPFTPAVNLLGVAATNALKILTNPLNNTAAADDAAPSPGPEKGGSGHWENVADTDHDPTTALPAYPDPDPFVVHGADRPFLSPESFIVADLSTEFPLAAPPTADSVFVADRPAWVVGPTSCGQHHLRHVLTSPGVLLPEIEVAVNPLAVNSVALYFRGVPPVEFLVPPPTLYVSIYVNGVQEFEQPFTHDYDGQQYFWTSLGGIYVPPVCDVMSNFGVNPGDEVHVRVRCATNVRTYFTAITLSFGEAVAWAADTNVDPGFYYNVKSL